MQYDDGFVTSQNIAADGGTVVKVLCYKSEGCWFDPRPVTGMLYLYLYSYSPTNKKHAISLYTRTVFASLLLLPHYKVETSSSVTRFHIPSVYAVPFMSDTVYHNQIRQQSKLKF